MNSGIDKSANESTVAITVTDNGVGIPADKVQAVFEPFVQVGRDFNSTHGGTGLGLSISRDLARRMGGDLTAESRLGEMSEFTLTLARYSESPPGNDSVGDAPAGDEIP